MSTSGKKNVTLNKISGPNNDIKGIYAVEVTEYVEDGVTDFITEVIKYENADDLEGTYIGKYSEEGTLEIYEGNENEEQFISKLDYAMTKSAVSITPSGLTATEKLKYNLRTGNRNIDEVPLSKAELKLLYGADYDDSIGSQVGGQLGDILKDQASKPDFNQDINVNIKGRNARTTYGNYCYPEDIRDDRNQDRIKFTMKYSKGTRIKTTTAKGVKIFERRQQSIDGSVTLPIQSGIKDQNSVKWDGSSLNPLQAFGAGAAINLFEEARNTNTGIAGAVNTTGNILNEAAGALTGPAGSDTRTAINVYLAQQAVGTKNLLSRTAGAIVNPNIEMLFNAPSLRPFSFQFRMSPRDEDEAAQVRSIISFFKQGMAVKTSSSNIFLKAPNIFDIRYITYAPDKNGKIEEVDHPSINRIKTCALLAAAVDYTPDGSYMTYDDPRRSMTSYSLTLQFNELDPIYEDDYIDDLGMRSSTNTANEIGF